MLTALWMGVRSVGAVFAKQRVLVQEDEEEGSHMIDEVSRQHRRFLEMDTRGLYKARGRSAKSLRQEAQLSFLEEHEALQLNSTNNHDQLAVGYILKR